MRYIKFDFTRTTDLKSANFIIARGSFMCGKVDAACVL